MEESFILRVHRRITSPSLFVLEMLQFSESSPEFFESRGPRTVRIRHSLRNLAMINDRLAAHSFKQQSFPREKILYIRNERSERLFSLYLPFKITFCPQAGVPLGVRAISYKHQPVYYIVLTLLQLNYIFLPTVLKRHNAFYPT